MSFRGSDNDRSSEKEVLEESKAGSTDGEVAAEHVALRKVDWHVLPMVFLFYMVSFLDR